MVEEKHYKNINFEQNTPIWSHPLSNFKIKSEK